MKHQDNISYDGYISIGHGDYESLSDQFDISPSFIFSSCGNTLRNGVIGIDSDTEYYISIQYASKHELIPKFLSLDEELDMVEEFLAKFNPEKHIFYDVSYDRGIYTSSFNWEVCCEGDFKDLSHRSEFFRIRYGKKRFVIVSFDDGTRLPIAEITMKNKPKEIIELKCGHDVVVTKDAIEIGG